MDRVSVPLWGAFLSEPLPIVALVGRCPANWLIGREPIRHRLDFQDPAMWPGLIWGIRRRFRRLSPCDGHVAHALRTLSPVAARVLLPRDAPRLACVKPAASVHPEPGSNSSLYLISLPLIRHPSFLIGINALDSFSVLACTSFSLFNDLVKTPFLTSGITKVQPFFRIAKIFSFFFDHILFIEILA